MTLKIGILCFPDVQQLDLAAPYEVFASARETEVRLVWKTTHPVRSVTGLMLTPDLAYSDAPAFDVLCVPGGAGINALLGDEETLDFLRRQAGSARYVTSVCTGALVLGAAGLLEGKRAATHWNAVDFLSRFGAIAAPGRVVRDGTLFTAGGVTSGIDFALTVLAELSGRDEAELVQLCLEYAPEPPFASGTPDEARPEILAATRQRLSKSRAAREAVLAGLGR
jgi:cyclohexyl-isocyanide hydratase